MVTSKTVKSQFGNIELDIPGNVKSEYDPKVIPKHTKNISGLEEKIISLYSRGMSTRDIHDEIKDLYGIEIFTDFVGVWGVKITSLYFTKFSFTIS